MVGKITDIERRMGDVEAKLEITTETMIRHVAGCEKLGQSAAEWRERMERSTGETRTRMEIIGSELTVKLDKVITRINEQDGALKMGRFIWAVLVIASGIIGWSVSHISLMK